MNKQIVILFSLIFLLPTILKADIKTIIKSVNYIFEGSITPAEAEEIALIKVKNQVLEEVGELIQKTRSLKNYLNKNQINSLASSTTRIQIRENSRFDTKGASGLKLTVAAEIDINALDRKVQSLLEMKEIFKNLTDLEMKQRELLERIIPLEIEVKSREFSAQEEKYQNEIRTSIKVTLQKLQTNELIFEALSLWLEGGHYDQLQAIQVLDKAIGLKFEGYTAQHIRGVFLLKMDQCSRAVNDFSFIIKHSDDRLVPVYLNRGFCYSKLGNYQSAIDDYSYYLKFNKDYRPAYKNRAEAYMVLENYEKALDDLKTVITLTKEPDAEMYFDVGRLELELGNYLSSIDTFSKAIDLEPEEKLYREKRLEANFRTHLSHRETYCQDLSWLCNNDSVNGGYCFSKNNYTVACK